MDFNPATVFDLLKRQLELPHPLDTLVPSRVPAKQALLASFLKKWEPTDVSDLERIGVDSFLRSNDACRQYSVVDDDSLPWVTLRKVRESLRILFSSGPLQTSVLTLNRCLDEGSAGPGASVGTNKRNDFYRKMFATHLSTTDMGLYQHYFAGISSSWREAEVSRLRSYRVRIVKGSNLSTVRKNKNTDRTICTEPSLNMWYQQGAGRVLEKMLLARHNIDMSLQPKWNRLAARVGSFCGNFATIDLSNASDMISLRLLDWLLPRQVMRVLRFIRSPCTIYRGKAIELYMISSMGNGFTFPLMSLVFAELVRAVYEQMGINPETGRTKYDARGLSRNYGVFGDDIICVTEAYDAVVDTLTAAGFLVNKEKSFATGPFRESCGGDYFRAVNIRGVYLRKVRHEADIYSCINRLVRWSAFHGINITDALQHLLGLVKFRPVPFDVGDAQGVKVPLDLLHGLKRSLSGAWMYSALEKRLPQLNLTAYREDDFGERNAEGELIAHVGGFLRNHQCTPRSEECIWKVVRGSTHSWDWLPHPGLEHRDLLYIWQQLLPVSRGVDTRKA